MGAPSSGEYVIRVVSRRIVEAALALLLLAFIVFMSAHATGDPVHYLLPPEASSAADVKRLSHLLGLDKPLPEQFWLFLVNAVHGNLGTSFIYSRPVGAVLWEALPATLELALVTLVFSILVGVPLGVLAAVRRGSLVDRITMGTSILSMAAPQFWIGIMLIVLFTAKLRLLPAYGYGSLSNLVLPTLTLSLTIVAGIVRLTRSSMLEVLGSDFVKFARIRGLSPTRVIFKHALRNALIPVITFAGITLGTLLNGVIVVETVFAWPGLGYRTVQAAVELDFPVLQGAVLLDGLFFIAASMIADLAYYVADPRLRDRIEAAR